MQAATLGYPDLPDPDVVFKALLGYGMFGNKIPPCFSSSDLLSEKIKQIEKNQNMDFSHQYIEYRASRHTNIPRQFGIPHPRAYYHLCWHIKENWEDINKHIGKPQSKFNFIHVRNILNKDHIFEMQYSDKIQQEDAQIEYSLGSEFIVETDIVNFFPSIYTHAIPWAIEGKSAGKKSQKKRTRWNTLDKSIRIMKGNETNGILIGPHTSNIISEIILSSVDCSLQKEGFNKVIRRIDDYNYYAKNEKDAHMFLNRLDVSLKEYGLILNQKKTQIIPISKYHTNNWVSKLNRFSFPDKQEIGFTSINAFIDYALDIAKKESNYAVLNYAIKIISGKKLTTRACKLYLSKIFNITLSYPYLLSLLEKYVFIFSEQISSDPNIEKFVNLLFKKGLFRGVMDAVSFAFYFAIKFDIQLKISKDDIKKLIKFNDCISTFLAYKYTTINNINYNDIFINRAKEIFDTDDIDRHWIFMYEFPCFIKDDKFLSYLHQIGVQFFNIN